MRACEMSGWGKLSLVGLGVWAMLAGIVWAAPPAADARNTRDSTRTDGQARRREAAIDDAARASIWPRTSPLRPARHQARQPANAAAEYAGATIRNPPPPGTPGATTRNRRRRTPGGTIRRRPNQARQFSPPRQARAPSRQFRRNQGPAEEIGRRSRTSARDRTLDKNQGHNLPRRDDRSGVGKGQPPVGRPLPDRQRPQAAGPAGPRQAEPGPGVPGGVPGGQPPRDAKQPRFSDRLKTGDLNRLSAGENAKKLRLADQYRLWQQGDVARRLELQRHGPPPKLYRGVDQPGLPAILLQVPLLGTVVVRRGLLVSDVESVGEVVLVLPLPSVVGPAADLVPAGGLRGLPRCGSTGRRRRGRRCRWWPAARGSISAPWRSRRSRPICNWWRCGSSIPAIPRRSWARATASGSATTARRRSRSRSTSCCLRATTCGWRPTCRRRACG